MARDASYNDARAMPGRRHASPVRGSLPSGVVQSRRDGRIGRTRARTRSRHGSRPCPPRTPCFAKTKREGREVAVVRHDAEALDLAVVEEIHRGDGELDVSCVPAPGSRTAPRRLERVVNEGTLPALARASTERAAMKYLPVPPGCGEHVGNEGRGDLVGVHKDREAPLVGTSHRVRRARVHIHARDDIYGSTGDSVCGSGLNSTYGAIEVSRPYGA